MRSYSFRSNKVLFHPAGKLLKDVNTFEDTIDSGEMLEQEQAHVSLLMQQILYVYGCRVLYDRNQKFRDTSQKFFVDGFFSPAGHTTLIFSCWPMENIYG